MPPAAVHTSSNRARPRTDRQPPSLPHPAPVAARGGPGHGAKGIITTLIQPLITRTATRDEYAVLPESATHHGGNMAKTIRQLREERGWSQLDMAVQMGASVGAVYKWERGLAVPHPQYRRRLAALFGISVEALALGPAVKAPQDRP
jgi:DNA-binding XRE family transcriptional regulator